MQRRYLPFSFRARKGNIGLGVVLACLATVMTLAAGPNGDLNLAASAQSAAQSASSPEAIRSFAMEARDLTSFKARREARLALVSPPPAPPAQEAAANNAIDPFIVAGWKQANLPEAQKPPEICDDATFQRRVYLDIVGVIANSSEAQKFVNDPDKDKRGKLVDALLARSADYAANWTPFWQEALCSAVNAGVGGVNTRGNYDAWIYKSLADDLPFDVMAIQLLDPTVAGHPAGYVRNRNHVETIQSAADTAQVFLGTGMKCASCHSHFENKEWPQTRFLGFAGLFAPDDLELIRCEKKSGKFVPAAFPFDVPGAPTDVPKDVNARLHLVAQLVTDPTNPRFARAIVNRLWKRYIGLGLFEPVDDYRADRPVSNPALLDWLAYDFMQNGDDLKHTIRLILTSRTYQLRYDPALEDHFDVAKPTAPRYFRSPSLRRLTAEQLLDSIRVATTQTFDANSRAWKDNNSTALSRGLGRPPARNEISTGRSDDVAVVQALELLNGTEYYQKIYTGPLLRQAGQEKVAAAVIDRLYWAALSRPATEPEKELGTQFIQGGRVSKPTAPPPTEIVWVDDALPEGAQPAGSWTWVTKSNGPVFSGEKSHADGAPTSPKTQHYFQGAARPLKAGPGDVFFAYVYLDPANPPKEIMLQFNDGSWEHRAYWGDDLIPFGSANSPSRHSLGPLPKVGEWVRLEVAATDVGFISADVPINGMSFDQAAGRVYWDKAGMVKSSVSSGASAPLGDVLWALFSSPEFQYIK